MRSIRRPLASHLVWLVLASLVPASWVAAALTMSVYDAQWQSATALVVGVVALLAGAAVSVLLGRELHHAIGDLALEAKTLENGRKPGRLSFAVGELQAVGDALAAAGQHLAPAPTAAERGFEPPVTHKAAPVPVATSTESVDVAAVVASVAAQTRGHARIAGLDLVLDIAPGVGTAGAAAVELEEALLRLVVNAITYTPRGRTIALAVDRVGDGVRIIVGDRAAAADAKGLRLAGHLIELTCGASAARNLRFARQLVERSGGVLSAAHIPGEGEIMAVTLADALPVRSAA